MLLPSNAKTNNSLCSGLSESSSKVVTLYDGLTYFTKKVQPTLFLTVSSGVLFCILHAHVFSDWKLGGSRICQTEGWTMVSTECKPVAAVWVGPSGGNGPNGVQGQSNFLSWKPTVHFDTKEGPKIKDLSDSSISSSHVWGRLILTDMTSTSPNFWSMGGGWLHGSPRPGSTPDSKLYKQLYKQLNHKLHHVFHLMTILLQLLWHTVYTYPVIWCKAGKKQMEMANDNHRFTLKMFLIFQMLLIFQISIIFLIRNDYIMFSLTDQQSVTEYSWLQ